MKLTFELDPSNPDDVQALEDLVRMLRQPRTAPAPRAKSKPVRLPLKPIPPKAEELEGVTSLERARVARAARAKGAL